jgi:hypothetical protein
MADDRFITMPEIAQLLLYRSPSSVYRLKERMADFPPYVGKKQTVFGVGKGGFYCERAAVLVFIEKHHEYLFETLRQTGKRIPLGKKPKLPKPLKEASKSDRFNDICRIFITRAVVQYES